MNKSLYSKGDFTEELARLVSSWVYESPYEGYNLPNYDYMVANGFGFASDIIRAKEFIALYKEGTFVGFGRMRLDDLGDVVIAIKLKPLCCGKGLGKHYMTLIIEEARIRFPNARIKLQVRKENRRAIACYQSVGFVTVDQVESISFSGDKVVFYHMVLMRL